MLAVKLHWTHHCFINSVYNCYDQGYVIFAKMNVVFFQHVNIQLGP